MTYIEYISQSLAKGTVGSALSVGNFVLFGVYMASGIVFGFMRGFSKSVIRFFTVILSAFASLYLVMATCNIIVNLTNKSDAPSLDLLIESYMPGVVSGFPQAVQSVLSEMSSQTATIFVMMIVCLFITPLLFISFFYALKTVTLPLYKLLCGLVGAIDYGKGIPSMIGGAIVGCVQGLLIAGVLLVPVSGLCGVVEVAKAPLMKNGNDANPIIADVYDNVLNDLVDNPVFETIDSFGGSAAYERMVSVTISGEKIHMDKESRGIIQLFADALPLITPDFNWIDPSLEQQEAITRIVDNIGTNELIASIVSDTMRGLAACVRDGLIPLPFSGANKALIEDVISIFHTSTKENVRDDLDMIADIYLIMCDKGLLVAFDEGNNEVLREMMTNKDKNGDTVVDVIISRLNASKRGKPIIHSFTKISLSLMQGSLGLDNDSAQLYEDVKGDIHVVLSHNKSDFATEEEYREAISADLDKAFADNDLEVAEDVKQSMLDYIEENYSDTSDITDDDINDAILSYYSSYATSKENKE